MVGGMKVKKFKPSFHFIYGVIIGVLLCALSGQTQNRTVDVCIVGSTYDIPVLVRGEVKIAK